MKRIPTHTAYTPMWEPGGKRFKQWLAIGEGWQDTDGTTSGMIHSFPIDPEENFTGYLEFVTVGEPPPPPLTTTRDEFVCLLYVPASRGEFA
jgi:hypothetical protein